MIAPPQFEKIIEGGSYYLKRYDFLVFGRFGHTSSVYLILKCFLRPSITSDSKVGGHVLGIKLVQLKIWPSLVAKERDALHGFQVRKDQNHDGGRFMNGIIIYISTDGIA